MSADAASPPELETLDPQLLVASAGCRAEHPLVEWARGRGIPVWGDVELAWRLRDKAGKPAEWLLVTGAGGITAELASAMLVTSGLRAAPAGDHGVPVLDAVRDPAGFDVLVVGLSPAQLHWVDPASRVPLAPLASACLAVQGEPRIIGRVFENTRVACVYHREDAATRQLVEAADVQEGCRAIGVGTSVPGPGDLGIVEGLLLDRAFHEDRARSALELATLEELRAAQLTTRPDALAVLAAAALARAAGATTAGVHAAVAGMPEWHSHDTRPA